MARYMREKYKIWPDMKFVVASRFGSTVSKALICDILHHFLDMGMDQYL